MPRQKREVNNAGLNDFSVGRTTSTFVCTYIAKTLAKVPEVCMYIWMKMDLH